MTDRLIARYVTGGFLSRRIRRIAALGGVDLRPGWPRKDESVAAWGHTPYAARAEKLAARTGAPILRIEDPFLRSLHPGRSGEAPLGLLIDRQACHFDCSRPSDLEILLATHPFDDGAVLSAARQGIEEFTRLGVTKYAATFADEAPPPGYVLVIDQTRGDASIRLGGATETTFREMLMIAREEHPNTPLLIKTHPETADGHRDGHFTEADATHGATLETRRLSPAALLSGAIAVYTVSSQLGFEAILHGHKPATFGQPFYAGWGLTDDRFPPGSAIETRRFRKLTRPQLFAGAMGLYPVWYDPHRDARAGALEVIRILAARARAWREDREGWSAPDMRLWKRASLRRFLSGDVTYQEDPDRRRLIWGAKGLTDGDAPSVQTGGAQGVHRGCTPETDAEGQGVNAPAVRIEDGFLRSRGLGAELIPPLSLVLDRTGIYYDPSRPSDLEKMIERAAQLPHEALERARQLQRAIVEAGLSKYNLARPVPDLPEEYILVVGQVSDDASVVLGKGGDNAALLRAARAAHPDKALIYKPHPDVEAGLRDGAIDAAEADLVAAQGPAVPLVSGATRVWTMTSLMGFEALLRGVPVTTTGAPFYAGWGLTDDRGAVPLRRRAARPSLEALVHAVLIEYPRYFDPVTGTACPPETIVHRLTHGPMPSPGPANRMLSKAQGALASYAHLWR
ncbi:capsular polysaccharide biosynthesis protein [Jannaschia aquimarina]|uniref:Capsule polysaccharide biosynthesis protein n=1 Tax=Jannaschia aquimarina TaxID=935700 RepID=A0A0D1ELW9_9RHOB|nr:capsular polysaccharide biosynthesis protein [Jannaschia aquimarina]KIT17971.1 Capsule polysaccharide biosynthesis protein [Jannaschia aquimarina]SNT04712.1 capsular polysaccharide export protein [Jannaschia aquimarina]